MTAAETLTERAGASTPKLIANLESAAESAIALRNASIEAVRAKVAASGKIDNAALEREEHIAHGLAWIATYVEGIRQLASYAKRLNEEGRFGEMEALLTQIGAGEYLAQLAGGVVMSQNEIVRAYELGVSDADQNDFLSEAVTALIHGNTPEARARVVELIRGAQGNAAYGDPGLDETIEAMREEMRRFSDVQVVPHAHEWHLKDEYVPLPLVAQMAELGVFSITLPADYGGLGLGKEAMWCGS